MSRDLVSQSFLLTGINAAPKAGGRSQSIHPAVLNNRPTSCTAHNNRAQRDRWAQTAPCPQQPGSGLVR